MTILVSTDFIDSQSVAAAGNSSTAQHSTARHGTALCPVVVHLPRLLRLLVRLAVLGTAML